MKQRIRLILTASLLLIALSGCGAKKANSLDEVTATPTPTIGLQEKVSPTPTLNLQAEATKVPEEVVPEKVLNQFDSDLGYSIFYEEDSFNFRNGNGHDEYILKASEEPFVFVSVARIAEESIPLVKASALGDSYESGTVGSMKLPAEYKETKISGNNGSTFHNYFLCYLESGEALLIESQWYTINDEDPYSKIIKDMIDSITVSGKTNHVSEYGVLSDYDAAKRELSYRPIEIVDENDTKRIEELEALGVELDFPNGFYLYEPSKDLLSFPVSETVLVSLLNKDYVLEDSNIESLENRLKIEPDYFICKLLIVEGNIQRITEKFIP